MDLQIAAILSLGETALWARIKDDFHLASQLRQLLVLFLAQYALLKVYRMFLYPRLFSPLRHLPGPKNDLPFIGQMGNIISADSPMEPFLTWSATWPEAPLIRYTSLGNQDMLFVNTPEAHKEVLQTHCYAFQKPNLLYRLVGDIIGRGLLFSEGAEHKRQRRILLELFSVPNMRKIFPVFKERSAMMAQWFEDHLDQKKGIFDVADCYSRIGLDVVGLTVLGVDLGHLKPQSDPKWDFLECYHRIFQPPKLSGIISAVNAFVPIRWCLPIEANLGHTRAVNRVRQVTLDCVRQRIKDVDAAVEKDEKFKAINLQGGGRDLLTLVVEERRRFKGTEDELTDVEIMNQMLTFLAAGHETTAGAMIWASYVLSTHPDVQAKLRSEVMEMVNESGLSGVTWEKIDRLRYFNNFIKETLRLFCPPLNSYRQATADLNICGTHVPKGTILYWNMAVPNRSKASWGENALQFVPERWDTIQGDGISPYAFQAFSSGPRFCIGKNFALLEIKTFLVEMVSRFRFIASPEIEALGGKHPSYQSPSLTLMPKGGLRVKLEKI